MENKISVHNLKKNFGKLEVLKDISIEIREEEVVCMIGPSGSGKNMFLRCLDRLEKITSDHVIVNGYPVSDLSTSISKVRENTGMVFQHFDLLPHLTVKENVTLAPTELKLAGKEETSRRALEPLAWVGLADKAEAYPGQLSGRQKQRMAIARSLAMNSDIMLSDESMSALDLKTVSKVLEVMKQLTTDDTTMVMVTHETGFAREVADRVAFMDSGYIVEEGTPDKVFGNPREERTRNFLDKMSQKAGFHEG